MSDNRETISQATRAELSDEINLFKFKLDTYRDHCIQTHDLGQKDIADLMLYRAGLDLVRALDRTLVFQFAAEDLSHKMPIGNPFFENAMKQIKRDADAIKKRDDRIQELEAENERLREALEYIVRAAHPHDKVRVVAREALK